MVSESSFDWEKDPFLSKLKDEKAYLTTANTTNKWTLLNLVIGKTLNLLGVNKEDVLNYTSKMPKKDAVKIFIILMRFQKYMKFDILNGLLEFKIPGFSESNLFPSSRERILHFLNDHVRVNTRR